MFYQDLGGSDYVLCDKYFLLVIAVKKSVRSRILQMQNVYVRRVDIMKTRTDNINKQDLFLPV